MQRIRIKYNKDEPLKFVGHLDFIKVYEKALRRTDLPIAYSQGFNPRLQISWGPPLPLGITSDCELADLYFDGWVRPEKVKEDLNKALPEGTRILEASLCHPSLPSVAAEITASEYTFTLAEESDLTSKINALLDRKEVTITRESKGEKKQFNARPMIFQVTLENRALKAVIQSSNQGSLKPAELLELLRNPLVKKVKRTKLLVDGHRPL